jgi:hypothetical protein
MAQEHPVAAGSRGAHQQQPRQQEGVAHRQRKANGGELFRRGGPAAWTRTASDRHTPCEGTLALAQCKWRLRRCRQGQTSEGCVTGGGSHAAPVQRFPRRRAGPLPMRTPPRAHTLRCRRAPERNAAACVAGHASRHARPAQVRSASTRRSGSARAASPHATPTLRRRPGLRSSCAACCGLARRSRLGARARRVASQRPAAPHGGICERDPGRRPLRAACEAEWRR